ncbi:MAG: S1/P1 nuclease, partial [Sphingomonadales bacterium]|nr:S1/P1 nuclease [Sphingomonadales bacterium]
VASPILLWSAQSHVLRKRPWETAAMLLITAALSVATFWLEAPPSLLLLPVLALAAFRLNMLGAALTGAVAAFLGNIMTTRGQGLFASYDISQSARVALTQAFIATIVVVAMLIGQEAAARLSAQREREVEHRERVRLEALAFLVHFVGDIHQPLHAGDHADRGGNDLKTTYGVMPGYNLHSVWDGLLADRALSAAPAIVRTFAPAEKAAVDQGNVRLWSEENWAISKDIAYPRAVDGDPCGAKPTAPVVIDEDDVTASRAALRQQVERGGIRLARVLEQALS